MRNVRPTAASFSTIVRNLVATFETREAGYWTSFMAGSAPVDVSVGYEARTLYLHLDDGSAMDMDCCPAYLETIMVFPNTDPYESRQWDVAGDRMLEGQRVTLASFKGLDAAIGFALERVCARNWHAGAQDQHDPVAV